MPARVASAQPYRAKRAFDIALTAPALLVAAPFMAVIAIAVRLTSPGPAIHRATRVGRNGVPFTLYKFRSMRVPNGEAGTLITAAGDARITPVGRLLRASKLDELPQLLNVLSGVMSLVGPRPEDPAYVDRYTEQERLILEWKPGITSPASIEYRHEEEMLQSEPNLEAAYAKVAAAKLQLDLAYFPTSSLRTDLAVIIRTIRSIFT